jgi:hypothetical protein
MPSHKPLLPKSAAKERGIPRFFTGKPCARGHVADRVTASGNCLACQRLANADHYTRTLKRRRQTELKPRILEQARAYNARNAEAISERRRERYAARRDEMIARRRAYYRNNLPAIIATNRRMIARRLQRMPSWLTDDQVREIVAKYQLAAKLSIETGIKHHVDHIVPLQGKTVSGLHVPWNLQVIPALDNLRKSNKLAA